MTESFNSWAVALSENKLTPEQIAVLQAMCDQGEAQTLAAAAAIRDWQDHIIDPPEHMYGF